MHWKTQRHWQTVDEQAAGSGRRADGSLGGQTAKGIKTIKEKKCCLVELLFCGSDPTQSIWWVGSLLNFRHCDFFHPLLVPFWNISCVSSKKGPLLCRTVIGGTFTRWASSTNRITTCLAVGHSLQAVSGAAPLETVQVHSVQPYEFCFDSSAKWKPLSQTEVRCLTNQQHSHCLASKPVGCFQSAVLFFLLLLWENTDNKGSHFFAVPDV